MQRRPWPLVVLASLQILGPIGSILISAYVNKVGFFEMATAIWRYSRLFDLLGFYALPLVQGILIFSAKRTGYYVVIALGIFSTYLNISEWRIARDVISLPIFLCILATNLGLIAYLLLPSVRAVFMNPRLRWWETPPRYVVDLKGQASKADGNPTVCAIGDVSIGGAGIVTDTSEFANGESILLTFENGTRTLLMRAVVVYGRGDGTTHRYGLEWQRGSEEDEKLLLAYIKELENKGTPVTRAPPKVKEDLMAWLARASKSPKAWVPEVPGRPTAKN